MLPSVVPQGPMVQPHRGLWVTDPGAFPFDDRVTVAAGWFGSPLPIGSRALGSRLSGFYPFPPCRVGDPGALALDVPDPHDARLTVPPVGLDPPWQPVAVPGLSFAEEIRHGLQLC